MLSCYYSISHASSQWLRFNTFLQTWIRKSGQNICSIIGYSRDKMYSPQIVYIANSYSRENMYCPQIVPFIAIM